MKHVFFLRISSLVFLSLLVFSCASRKNVAYYQNIDSLAATMGESFEPTLQPDDLLMILVFGENPEVVAPFNSPLQSNTETTTGSQGGPSYLIDANGNIQFPLLGAIQLAGLTKTQAVTKMTTALSKYITNPSLNLRILNFKVTVQGEVNAPGVHTIASERITLMEALSLSGDLTIYGKRNNILMIRETNGKKEAVRVDITQADFINSPYYYLAQNDMIYVEPNKTRINGAGVGPNTGIILSAISLLVTVIALTLR